MKFTKLQSVTEDTSKYCHFAKDYDYMEVITWGNGEGKDVIINSRNLEQRFSLSHGEYELLNVLMNIEECEITD